MHPSIVETKKYQRLEYIDFLRGLAICLVILSHVSLYIKDIYPILFYFFFSGQFGVQLFFLITGLLFSIKYSEGNFDIKSFYIKRLFRIIPLYYIGMLVWILYIFFFGNKVNLDFFYIVQQMLFLNSLDRNNFSPAILPGGWSISTEMIFYLLFPLIIFFFKKNMYLLCISIILMSLILFLTSIFLFQPILLKYKFISHVAVNDNFSYLYCLILNQINAFIIGMLTFVLLKKMSPPPKFYFFLFIILYLISVFFLNTKTKTGINGYFSVMFSSVAFSVLIILIHNKSYKSYFKKAIIKIGIVSYSIFVFHSLFIIFLSNYTNKISLFIIDNYFYSQSFVKTIEFLLVYFLTILFSYYISTITYKFIEIRGIKYGNRFLN
jgi:peptidoglycan/LPS O-acetylase OafA/YrhL